MFAAFVLWVALALEAARRSLEFLTSQLVRLGQQGSWQGRERGAEIFVSPSPAVSPAHLPELWQGLWFLNGSTLAGWPLSLTPFQLSLVPQQPWLAPFIAFVP